MELAHHIRVFWLPPEKILRQRPLHGVIAFDGPNEFIAKARSAGLVVWLQFYPVVRAVGNVR